MDFLSGEIDKLKRKAPASEDKYIRRSDLEARRQEEYRQDQQRLVAKREERELEKLSRLQEHEASKRRKIVKPVEEGAIKDQVDIDTVRQELRELEEPICLFGEAHIETSRRLSRVKACRQREAESSGRESETVFDTPPDAELPAREAITCKPAWLTENEESRKRLDEALFLLLRSYFKEWQDDVQKYEPVEAVQAIKLHQLARDHLSSLLLRLKANNLPQDIMTNLTNICLLLNRKDYLQANQTYLQMSIGKATWPVGVAMVGIHERAQRERKHKEIDGAHILSDETTRQWLQSLQRLITHFEQKNKP